MEIAIRNLLTKKNLVLHAFTGIFYKKYKEEIISMVYKLFQTIEKRKTLSNLFYEGSIT